MSPAIWMWGHGVWFPFAFLTGTLFWIVVIVVVVRLLRDRDDRPRQVPQAAPSPALRVLEERYARGDIGREEFLERRATLLGVPHDPSASEPGLAGPSVPPVPPAPNAR